ncbi:iron-containing alcohol dehydrogenase [Anaerotalea alkaliphila]|uniref:Iron-containing alcohol dehydrogenase n=1 Tax=Anaerotalea alkaliphila TaxID=2662126 RepID=A0A7X5HU19_9FIRM|nr:iron-containing alcohol dehydrogenase [Anaerotalea alkaliphila]NDL66660.1 iron-containing alcohol dehydrogenase [Anaerotalea alkaliphila]
MVEQYKLKMPKAVYAGTNALDNIGEIIGGSKSIAIFTDKGVIGAGLLDLVIGRLDKDKTEIAVFDELPTEPTYGEVQEIVDGFKKRTFDLIIAVGGGSVMDTAKLASVLVTEDYDIRDLLDNPAQARKSIRTLMIPTTAGTGSEATPNSIVVVPEKELKVGIVNDEMIADHVILDPLVIKNLPRKIAAATGIDALAHAIECYTSKKANPFSDTFALEALKMIFDNIEKACDSSDDMEAKGSMLVASFYAGVAITTSGTTAVHALSYPLGGKYRIPHGVSNAMMLVPVMKFNEPVCRGLFANIYDRIHAEGGSSSEEEKSSWVIDRLDAIVKNLDIPTSLSSYGIGDKDLETLVESGMQVQRLLVNNRREVTADDARALYKQLL